MLRCVDMPSPFALLLRQACGWRPGVRLVEGTVATLDYPRAGRGLAFPPVSPRHTTAGSLAGGFESGLTVHPPAVRETLRPTALPAPPVIGLRHSRQQNECEQGLAPHLAPGASLAGRLSASLGRFSVLLLGALFEFLPTCLPTSSLFLLLF